jgi:hypothetical protein
MTSCLRRLWPLTSVAAISFPSIVFAQFSDPRTYLNMPVGLNQLELDYAHVSADASIDTSLVVEGAHLDGNAAASVYTRSFGVLQHLAWAKASVPWASVTGSVPGAGISRSVSGFGDASLQLTALLRGGPALSVQDFESYVPATTVGVSLTITGPTGEYDPNRLLNLGSDRWSFKPQFAVSHPFGPDHRWEIDGYASVSLFTDNTNYHGHEVLRQEPLFGLEGHISHDLTPDLWASLDASYAFRGDTVVDGVHQHDPQEALILGAETSWSPNPHNSIALVLAKAVVHQNAPTYTGVTIKYSYTWAQGY